MPNKKKELTEEQKKEIALLRSNNKMYEDTIKQVELRGGDEKAINRIKIAKADIEEKLKQFGEDANATPEQIADSHEDEIINMINANNDDVNIYIPDSIDAVEDVETIDGPTASSVVDILNTQTDTTDEVIEVRNDTFAGDENEGVQYDVIPLPSNGECYANKLARIPVSYLTAYDENMIMSPNLYRDGLIIEYLLKNKVINKEINVDDLVTGDVDAITLFLRATSYGTEFPISVRDPKSGEVIDTVIDLSTLKNKEFKLKGDANGNFDFDLPKTKAHIKFKYLTRRDEKMLERLSNMESEDMMAGELKSAKDTIETALKMDKILSSKDKQVIIHYNKQLDTWITELMKKKKTAQFSKLVTNRMEMQIVSINGNTDRKYIHKAVMQMPAQDALALRKYMLDNEPGIDFNIKVERPESLGGGSIDTFLDWEDTVFLNLA